MIRLNWVSLFHLWASTGHGLISWNRIYELIQGDESTFNYELKVMSQNMNWWIVGVDESRNQQLGDSLWYTSENDDKGTNRNECWGNFHNILN